MLSRVEATDKKLIKIAYLIRPQPLIIGVFVFMNIEDKVIKEITADLESKKRQVILQRLADLNIDLDLEEEAEKRFKSLAIVSESYDTETIYYNDGSVNGLRVITFIRVDTLPTLDDMRNISIKSELKYY